MRGRQYVELLFPAIVGESAQDPTTGGWRHAWTELTPALDVYRTEPGARSGTATVNWATEVMNRRTAAGTLVWMRHRDQIEQIHYEFENCCACQCQPCYSGVEVTGPALAWIDGAGSWAAVDLAGATGALVVTAGAPAVGGVFMPLVPAPAAAGSAGTAGQIAYDSGWLYVCVAGSTWKRAALSSW